MLFCNALMLGQSNIVSFEHKCGCFKVLNLIFVSLILKSLSTQTKAIKPNQLQRSLPA